MILAHILYIHDFKGCPVPSSLGREGSLAPWLPGPVLARISVRAGACPPSLSHLSSLRDESCSPRIIVLNCTTREWERDGLGRLETTAHRVCCEVLTKISTLNYLEL